MYISSSDASVLLRPVAFAAPTVDTAAQLPRVTESLSGRLEKRIQSAPILDRNIFKTAVYNLHTYGDPLISQL